MPKCTRLGVSFNSCDIIHLVMIKLYFRVYKVMQDIAFLDAPFRLFVVSTYMVQCDFILR